MLTEVALLVQVVALPVQVVALQVRVVAQLVPVVALSCLQHARQIRFSFHTYEPTVSPSAILQILAAVMQIVQPTR